MKLDYVIKSALLSEKAYNLMESGVYTFLVDRRATKKEIKKAIEAQFGTTVIKVNVLNKSAKSKQVTGTRKKTLSGAGRKAVVYLKAGEKIAMLSPKSEEKASKGSKVSTPIKSGSKAKDESKPEEKKGFLSKIKKPKTEDKEGDK